MESFVLSWHCGGHAWPRVLQGGGRRQEVCCGGSVCARQGRGASPHGGDPTSSSCCSLSAPLLWKNPVSPFSLPFSPLLMPVQVPAAPRPPHLAGRETRFVSAVGVRCALCPGCSRCPNPSTAPQRPGPPGAPPGLTVGAAPRGHPGHEGLLPLSCCCDGTCQCFGEELRGDGFARARGQMWRVGTCPGTVSVGQEQGLCPGARTVPDVGAEFGDVQRAARASSHGTGAGRGSWRWALACPHSKKQILEGRGSVGPGAPHTGCGQWGRGKLKVFGMNSRFTPVFLFAGFH